MFWIDVKYCNMLGQQLDKFVVKKTQPSYLANCRCPICLDSQRNKNKARGYFFTKNNSIFYKCHNCGVGLTLSNLIKKVNSGLYKEYNLELFKEGNIQKKPKKEVIAETNFKPNFNKVDSQLIRGDKCSVPLFHEYCERRMIPKKRYKDIYYSEDLNSLPGIELKTKYEDSRVVFPCYFEKHLVGLQCRTVKNSKHRYKKIKYIEDKPMLYNFDNLNKEDIIYVVEGSIDSLFLPNSVAINSAALHSISLYLPKDKCVLIYDNQPRNEEVCKLMEKSIREGYALFIWPSMFKNNVKDINDLVLAHKLSERGLVNLINKNTFTGLQLKVEFNRWRKI